MDGIKSHRKLKHAEKNELNSRRHSQMEHALSKGEEGEVYRHLILGGSILLLSVYIFEAHEEVGLYCQIDCCLDEHSQEVKSACNRV